MEDATYNQKLAGRIVRVFFFVLACMLLLTGYDHYAPLVRGNDLPVTAGGAPGILYFRNRRIDRLTPSVSLSADSAWTQDDIQSAAAYLKGFFKLQTIEYGLCAVRFNEDASDRVLQKVPAPPDGRLLALFCDYNVYDDTAADEKGYYPDAVFVLQQSADGNWHTPRGSDPALQAIVCPLERHRF